MLELKKGEDILAVVGGVADVAGARKVFAENLDGVNLKKLSVIQKELIVQLVG